MIGSARILNIVETDVTGAARPDTANPDMGAYENSLHAPTSYTPVTWHVDTSGTDEVVYSNISTSNGPFESIDWVWLLYSPPWKWEYTLVSINESLDFFNDIDVTDIFAVLLVFMMMFMFNKAGFIEPLP